MQTVLELDEGELPLRLGTALWWFWFTRGKTDWKEGSAFLDQALEKNEGVGGAVRAKVLIIVGQLASRMGDFKRANLSAVKVSRSSRRLGTGEEWERLIGILDS